MLTHEENALLTRTGPETPMGQYLRRYWTPVLLAAELPEPDCPPVRVRVLGEHLVAFRDTQDRIGLLEELCPHRLASLYFGRNEECGLRCVYHGWKFDVEGRCVDMPNEPADSRFKEKIRTCAYPAREWGGLIWAYLGPP
ncbi:MAG TPA: Rieske 2Fe-2S domain-containing protein, partial [Dehalococcoidia bacterium]|nr:Rieske 2Fe-2S domain-containing protein [Dehalococcoidia bacterium]